MKLVIITNNFPPVLDGVGDHTFFLAKKLGELKYEVTIICNSNVKPFAEAFAVLPIVKKWDKDNNRHILEEIEKIRPDSILLQYVPYAYNFLGIPFAIVDLIKTIRSRRINCSVIFHEVAIRYNLQSPKRIVAAILQRLIAYKICKAANNIITSIDKYQYQLQKISGKKVNKVMTPPNFDTAMQISKDYVNRIKKNIAPENVVIGLFGIRNAEFIIRVYEEMITKQQNITLLVCGNNQLSELDSRYLRNIYITGFLSQEELPLYLSACDVFWAADICIDGKGGSSNKSGSLAAALFLGLPVVATRGDMNNSELVTAANVQLVEYTDTSGIAATLLKVANSSTKEMKEANEYWRKKLSWESTTKEYINIIEND